MSLFEWKPNYSVDIDEVDNQHKHLIDLMNNLHDAMLDKKSKDFLGDLIGELRSYTEYHFSEEEKNFKNPDSPNTKKHLEEHAYFIDKIRDFESGFKEGKFTLSMDILTFLKDWLLDHIQIIDKHSISKNKS